MPFSNSQQFKLCEIKTLRIKKDEKKNDGSGRRRKKRVLENVVQHVHLEIYIER